MEAHPNCKAMKNPKAAKELNLIVTLFFSSMISFSKTSWIVPQEKT
jgi:hypothetical protein